MQRQGLLLTHVYKKTDERYIEWQQMTMNDSEGQQVAQRVTTNDNDWQRVTKSGTTSKKDTFTSKNGWLQFFL